MPFNLRQFNLQAHGQAPFEGLEYAASFYDELSSHMLWSNTADASELQTATVSVWFRRADWPAEFGYLVSVGNGAPATREETNVVILNTGELALEVFVAGTQRVNLISNAAEGKVYNDGDWHHVVGQLDMSNGTAGQRAHLFVDGVELTGADLRVILTPPDATYEHRLFRTNDHYAGRYCGAEAPYAFSGYMADINLVQGAVVAPSAFGEFVGPDWVWKDYVGAHGTNGRRYEFDFESNLGRDSSA